MLGPSMPKLLIMYCSRFSLIHEIHVFTRIYSITLSLISYTNGQVFLSFFPKFLCKDKISNRIKIRDVKILGKINVNLFLAMNLFRYPPPVL